MNPWRTLLQAGRRRRLRWLGVSLGANCEIGAGVAVKPGRGATVIGDDCTLETGVVLADYGGRITLDRWVYLGPYTVIYGHGGVTIGDGTLIAMHCRIVSSNHAMPPIGTPIRSQPDVLLPTKIGRDVWLGAGVTVLGGITIGDGCVVGAGAVVTRDLPPGVIAHGTPATIKGYRENALRAN